MNIDSRRARQFVASLCSICCTLAATLLPLPGELAAAGPDRVKLKITSAAASQKAAAYGGELMADYGSFQLWAVPAVAVPGESLPDGMEQDPGEDVIELNAGPIHTGRGAAKASSLPLAAETLDPGIKRLHLVQFIGPIQPGWHALLLEQGWQVVSHVPRNAYLVYGDASALSRLTGVAARATEIQWEAPYTATMKMPPTARQASAQGVEAARTGKPPRDDLFAVQLVDDENANSTTLQLLDAVKVQWVRRTKRRGHVNCVLRLPFDQLAPLAKRPDVISIQPYVLPQKQDERQGQILAGNLVGTQPSGPGYLAWLQGKGFTAAQFDASGFAVDVSDSGLDNGTQLPGHFGLYTLGNPGLASRVAYNRLVGIPNRGSTIQGCDGHGTLNTHLIAGYVDLAGFPHADSAGYHYGLGICPFVRVGSSVIFDPSTFTNPDFTELQSRAYQDGARISCNSWGASIAGAYNIDCQEYDALVRDAQPTGAPFPAAGNQEMVIVFSAGNSGPGPTTIGAPGSAKNIISVGATENVHPHSTTNGGNNTAGSDGCQIDDLEADSSDDIVSFSSRGPCDDGRIKPDLVAPGTHVTGGVAQGMNPATNGTAISCFAGSGVCALPGSGTVGSPNNFFPLGQQFYTTSSGTSHSCPAVGGAAALLRQFFINNHWTAPSPAMTKAWLMNSGRRVTGVGANDTLPSNSQGMGSVDLGMALDGVPRVKRDQLDEDRFTATGQTRVFQGVLTSPALPLRITLAWTDAPGSTSGNAYNNNLDLIVTVSGQTYRGNVFNAGLSVPGGTADVRNNVESVFLPAGLSGPFTVTVVAANINSDGVPNNADPLDQDFALVIYNSAEEDVLLIPVGATLLAEDCPPGNGRPDAGETVTMDFTLQNVGPSNTTALVATLLPQGGVLNPSGPQSYGVVSGGGGTASRPFSFLATGECGDMITCTLQLLDGTNALGTADFPVLLGGLTTNSVGFTNATSITVDATNGTVVPYPSTIVVAGQAGLLQHATVTLHGLSHTWPDDLDVLLRAPSGQTVMLLSDAGGWNECTNLTLTFDDGAGALLPDEAPLASGTWRPTDYESYDYLPAPAPAGPHGPALSALAGGNPNGTWQLLLADDYVSDDGGALLAGWSLSLLITNEDCCVDPASANLVLTVTDTPDPVTPLNVVNYALSVSNAGPAAATAVGLRSILSPGGSFLTGTVSQGSLSHSAGVVQLVLGTIPPGGVVTAAYGVLATAGPELICSSTVTGAETDPQPLNNHVETLTRVIVPFLAVQDTAVIEGDSGMSLAVFLVTLSRPFNQVVTVDYSTTNGTANAGVDYLAQANRLIFTAGEISKTIVVPIMGDVLDEPDETLILQLYNIVNASPTDTEATATILDDDAPPALWISDASVVEGQSGTNHLIFTVGLSAPSGWTVQTAVATSNGTAEAGTDYLALGRAVSLAPGQLTSNAAVVVNGDTDIERDETLLLTVGPATNAVLADDTGIGTILTDDWAPWIKPAGLRLESETGGTLPGVVEPGETVTVSFALRNDGSVDTTNLLATLVATNGVSSPSGPQTYGSLTAGGPQVSRPFTFTVDVVGCSTVLCTMDLAESGVPLGTVVFEIRVGDCFVDDFEPGIDLVQWSGFGGTVGITVLATNYGGSVSGSNSLWFGDAGSRYAASRPLDTRQGGTVDFWLRLAQGGPSGQWETLDLPSEAIVLEYSANGTTWTEMGRYTNTLYTNWSHLSADIPVPAQTANTRFRWRQLAHSGTCCDHWALDDVAVFTGPRPPHITEHPQDRSTLVGGSASFCVTAGGSMPLAYSWHREGAPILGATQSCYTLPSAQLGDTGARFSCRVSNAYGSVWSSNALLTVVEVGEFYDDFDPDIDLAQWAAFGGTVGTTVLATNYGGYVSAPNSLWFGDNSSRFAASRPLDVREGGSVSFSLRLASGSVSGQWETADLPGEGVVLEYSVNGGSTWVIFGRYDSSAYTVWTSINATIPGPAQTANTQFRWRQLANSGTCCDHWALDNVTVLHTALRPPTIITQPLDQTVTLGESAVFQVTASGTPPLFHQWRKDGTNLLDGGAISGATSNRLTVAVTTTSLAGLYSVVVTNALGSVTSTNALLTVAGWTNTLTQSNVYSATPLTFAFQDAPIPSGPGLLTVTALADLDAPSEYLSLDAEGTVTMDLFVTGGLQMMEVTTNVNLDLSLLAALAADQVITFILTPSANVNDMGPSYVRVQLDYPSAAGLHRFVWDAIASTQQVNLPFLVSLTAQDNSGNRVGTYAGQVVLSASSGVAPGTNTLLGSPPDLHAGAGSYTLGHRFTPNTNITVTHFRHFWGTKVSLWSDTGTLLASETVSGTPSTWVDTPLATPVQLQGGSRYVLAAWSAGGAYHWRTDGSTNFLHGTIGPTLYNPFDAFPTNTSSERWFLVDLRYATGSAMPVSVSPTLSGAFTNGVWTGPLSIATVASNVVLLADDGLGHVGFSAPLQVTGVPTAPVTPPLLSWRSIAGTGTLEFSWNALGFRLQYQTNGPGAGLSTDWFDVPGGTSSPVQVTPDPAQQPVFYRLVGP